VSCSQKVYLTIANQLSLDHLLKDASDNSSYHAWQTSLRKRLSNDLAFNINYSWSKTLSLAQGDFWPGNDTRVQDEFNYRADWGPNIQDVANFLAWDFIYNAPFDRWLKATGALKQVVGGWQIGGIFTARSGGVINVFQTSAYDSSRPDDTGADPYLKTADEFQYLNTAAFVRLPQGSSGATIRPGNMGKNNLRGPGAWNVDLSIAKEFKIRETYSLRFRVDMFNSLNHANLGNPISDIVSPDFGRIRLVSGARFMQRLAIRILE
jgi:hypothetical protein